MANNGNPFHVFPFDKPTLETLVGKGKLVPAVKKYFRKASRLILHPDQAEAGQEFVEFGIPADAGFKWLSDAYQRIEAATPNQIKTWLDEYEGKPSSIGGMSEEELREVFDATNARIDELEAHNAQLQKAVMDALRGQGINPSVIRGGADPAVVRQLEARVADAERQRDRYHADLNASVRDRDAARRQTRDLNTELDAMRRDKIAKQREADTYKGERDAARGDATKYEREAQERLAENKRIREALKRKGEERDYFANEASDVEAREQRMKYERDALRKQVETLQRDVKRYKAGAGSAQTIEEIVANVLDAYKTTQSPVVLDILEATARHLAGAGLKESASMIYDNPAVKYALGDSWLRRGSRQNAAKQFRAAYKLADDAVLRTDAALRLARIYISAGNVDEAQAWKEKAVAESRQKKKNAGVEYQLGLFYEEQGQLARANKHFRSAFENWEDGQQKQAASCIAQVYAATGQAEKAQEWLQKA